jgi:nucleotide sugar dehydrogenase
MELKEKLLNGEKKIAIWGTGFIGFTTMANFAFNGVRCLGYDVDKDKVDKINNGVIPIDNLEYWLGFNIDGLVKNDLIEATSDWNELMSSDIAVHFIAIPTEKEGEPYDDILFDVINKLVNLKNVAAGSDSPPLIIVESTLTPGRSDSVVLPIFEKAGVSIGKDILYGVAPRRDWFVSPEKSLKKLPRVFGGTTKEATDDMKDVLSLVCDNLVPAPDHKHAEMVKSIENAYRHMDITLANQLTMAYPSINMTEVLKLVGTKWNIGTFSPSFGVGGYCIPLSSQYVLLGAEKPEELSLLKDTIEFDKSMPGIVAKNMSARGIKNVGILGLAYKGDIKVSILSPTIKIAEKLKELGIDVKVNDPYYTMSEINEIAGVESFDFPAGLSEFDAILIVADHQHYKFTQHKDILENLDNCKIVIDNTGIWKDISFQEKGIKYHIAGDYGWMKA